MSCHDSSAPIPTLTKTAWGQPGWTYMLALAHEADAAVDAGRLLPARAQQLYATCIATYARTLPCPHCVQHASAYVEASPPPPGGKGALLQWADAMHASVRTRQHKPPLGDVAQFMEGVRAAPSPLPERASVVQVPPWLRLVVWKAWLPILFSEPFDDSVWTQHLAAVNAFMRAVHMYVVVYGKVSATDPDFMFEPNPMRTRCAQPAYEDWRRWARERVGADVVNTLLQEASERKPWPSPATGAAAVTADSSTAMSLPAASSGGKDTHGGPIETTTAARPSCRKAWPAWQIIVIVFAVLAVVGGMAAGIVALTTRHQRRTAALAHAPREWAGWRSGRTHAKSVGVPRGETSPRFRSSSDSVSRDTQ